MKMRARIVPGAGLLLISVLSALPASAGAPTEQVRGTVDNVLAVLKNPDLKSETKQSERRQQLRGAIYSRFDFTEMAKRSLGSHWRRLSPAEQQEFTEIFAELLEHAYVDKIEAYNDEKFVYVRELEDKEYAEVKTKIVTRKSEEFAINYKLRAAGAEWKIYDVVVENISLVNNYRSQFNRVIAGSSYKELVRRLRDKRIGAVR
jgi:phospholipid transport system substrate-binding protein